MCRASTAEYKICDLHGEIEYSEFTFPVIESSALKFDSRCSPSGEEDTVVDSEVSTHDAHGCCNQLATRRSEGKCKRKEEEMNKGLTGAAAASVLNEVRWGVTVYATWTTFNVILCT